MTLFHKYCYLFQKSKNIQKSILKICIEQSKLNFYEIFVKLNILQKSFA
jgi:hypothetical protein